jgi:hypothetical protein
MKKWAASVMRTRPWESTLSMIRMIIGLKSSPKRDDLKIKKPPAFAVRGLLSLICFGSVTLNSRLRNLKVTSGNNSVG